MKKKGIDQLLIDANKGNRRAAQCLVRRVWEGDQELLKVIQDAEKSKLKDAAASGCSWSAEDQQALTGLIDLAGRQPSAAWDQLESAWDLRSGTCYRGQVLGTRAQILRVRRLFAEADAVLDYAFEIAGHCRYATVDLKRRRGILRAKEGHCTEALLILNEALEEYAAMVGPGHDFRGNGVASCLFARGEPLLDLGEFGAAAADWRRCLTMFSPSAQPDIFVYSVINLARALFKGGLRCPDRELAYARQYFKGTRKVSIPRAVFNWLDGQVRFAKGGERCSRWRDQMIWARDDFIELEMYDEASAVSSDISLTWLRSRVRLRKFLERTLGLMGDAGPTLRVQLRLIQKKNDAEAHDQFYLELETAIRGLRDLVADRPGVIPCLLTAGVKRVGRS